MCQYSTLIVLFYSNQPLLSVHHHLHHPPSLPLPSLPSCHSSSPAFHRPCERDCVFNVPSARLRNPGTHFTLSPLQYFFFILGCFISLSPPDTKNPSKKNQGLPQFRPSTSSSSSPEQHSSHKVRPSLSQQVQPDLLLHFFIVIFHACGGKQYLNIAEVGSSELLRTFLAVFFG